MLAMNKVLQYIKASPSKGFYSSSSSDLQIKSYCDADWAGCPDTRRSLTGYSVFIGGSLISWRSKKQSVVSRSSAEAEYRAMTIVAYEITWVLQLLKDLRVCHSKPTMVFCDNQAALHIVANPVFHKKQSTLKLIVTW